MSTQSHHHGQHDDRQHDQHGRGFGPIDPATEEAIGYLRWLEAALDNAVDQCRATADAWRAWSAELARLTARMPALPELPDAEGDGARAVERDGIEPATLRAALTGPVRAADHYAAVYTRHADHLARALADVMADMADQSNTLADAMADQPAARPAVTTAAGAR